jgi:diguanylate cyclase (GGDEF)-like protein
VADGSLKMVIYSLLEKNNMNEERVIEERKKIDIAARGYEYLLKSGLALVPIIGIWYLYHFQPQSEFLEAHSYNYIAITLVILASSFAGYISWHSYCSSGEPFLRWSTVAFLGFAVIYAPHFLFIDVDEPADLIALHLFGSASRFTITLFLLIALLKHGKGDDPQEVRSNYLRWWGWMILFFVLDCIMIIIAFSTEAQIHDSPKWMESAVLVLASISLIIVLLRHRSLPLMMINALGLAWIIQSSIALMLARPWYHLWWYGYMIFGAGIVMLSYAAVRVFHTTGSFSTALSQEELIARLQAEQDSVREVSRQLNAANAELAWVASTDTLTGARNRRSFMEQLAVEVSRAKLSMLPFSLIAMSVDHFNSMNDQHGDRIGNTVLKLLVERVMESLRPHDVIGRVGNEDFLVLLPDTSLEAGILMAELIRNRVEGLVLKDENNMIRATVSIGIAELGSDGDMQEEILDMANARLSIAMEQGNLIVSS